MEQIAFYLKKFEQMAPEGSAVKDAAIALWQRRFNYTLPREAISLRNGTVFISLPPVYKTEAALYMDELQSELSESLLEKSPHHIV